MARGRRRVTVCSRTGLLCVPLQMHCKRTVVTEESFKWKLCIEYIKYVSFIKR